MSLTPSQQIKALQNQLRHHRKRKRRDSVRRSGEAASVRVQPNTTQSAYVAPSSPPKAKPTTTPGSAWKSTPGSPRSDPGKFALLVQAPKLKLGVKPKRQHVPLGSGKTHKIAHKRSNNWDTSVGGGRGKGDKITHLEINGRPLAKGIKQGIVPAYDRLYITLKSPFDGLQVSVMAGDEPPQITGGYGKWTTVDRPLRRGISVFQGYDPATMSVPLRFGMWIPRDFSVHDDGADGTQRFGGITWATSDAAGQQVERNIQVLEAMAGGQQTAGQPPFVYVNTYDAQGRTTGLVPPSYQNTAGAPSGLSDGKLWPWVITSVTWGNSLRSSNGWRIYQECVITLMNYLNYNRPQTKQQKGSYFKTSKSHHTCLKIAGARSVHALSVSQVASLIKNSHKNNPVSRSKIHLRDHSTHWNIPLGKEIWVPSHIV